MRSSVISAVMILVRLAIGTGASGAFASITTPVDRSARRAEWARRVGARTAFAGVASVVGNGERLPWGGTGVGGGPADPGAAREVSATGPAASAMTTPAATR